MAQNCVTTPSQHVYGGESSVICTPAPPVLANTGFEVSPQVEVGGLLLLIGVGVALALRVTRPRSISGDVLDL